MSPMAHLHEQETDVPDADEAAPAAETLSFMQPAPAAVFWQRIWVRAILLALAILLTFALLLQVAVHERDRLAAQFPAWQPFLQAVSEPLGYRVARLRQIDAISIEGSGFSRLAPGIYRLDFSLRNAALVDLAMPALEVTLTDAQDQTLIRRIVRPGELQADTAVLAARAEFNGSLVLSVQTAEDAARLAGYRLIAFYP